MFNLGFITSFFSKKKGVEVTCSICGKKFYKTDNYVRKYCSEECANIARKQHFQKYYETNKEKHNKVCNEYNKAHRESCRRNLNKFKQNHPDAFKTYVKNFDERRCNQLNLTQKEWNRVRWLRQKTKEPMHVLLNLSEEEYLTKIGKKSK